VPLFSRANDVCGRLKFDGDQFRTLLKGFDGLPPLPALPKE
jgi:hypothetical protein